MADKATTLATGVQGTTPGAPAQAHSKYGQPTGHPMHTYQPLPPTPATQMVPYQGGAGMPVFTYAPVTAPYGPVPPPHYKGIGVYAVDITKADNDLQTLFYAGEKPPHMWWEEFEKRLTRVFTTYVKKEARVVHSEDMKLRTLLSKIKADFLKPTKASIETELTAIPMVMTYSRALLWFRNEVSKIHPPQMNNQSTCRNINQVDSGR
eukprot:scaffold2058_cov57-Attheya_sp.AAC.1